MSKKSCKIERNDPFKLVKGRHLFLDTFTCTCSCVAIKLTYYKQDKQFLKGEITYTNFKISFLKSN